MKNTTDLCDSYLKHLHDDHGARGEFVEALRAAAARIEDTASLNSFGAAEGNQVEAIMACVHWKIARKLREAAASLCDHQRTHGPYCRYCESVLTFAQYDTNIHAREIE